MGTIRAAVRGFAQRLGDTRAGVLAIGRVVSPLQRRLYRSTGGRFPLAGRAPVLLLTTTGRRTGKARTVPLLYLRDGDRVVVCNVNPGFERPSRCGRARCPETSWTATGPGWQHCGPPTRSSMTEEASDRFSCSSRIAGHDASPGADPQGDRSRRCRDRGLGVLALLFPGQLIPGYEHYTGHIWPALMHTSPATGQFILVAFRLFGAERRRWPSPRRDRADRLLGMATVGLVDAAGRQRHRAGGTDHL